MDSEPIANLHLRGARGDNVQGANFERRVRSCTWRIASLRLPAQSALPLEQPPPHCATGIEREERHPRFEMMGFELGALLPLLQAACWPNILVHMRQRPVGDLELRGAALQGSELAQIRFARQLPACHWDPGSRGEWHAPQHCFSKRHQRTAHACEWTRRSGTCMRGIGHVPSRSPTLQPVHAWAP